MKTYTNYVLILAVLMQLTACVTTHKGEADKYQDMREGTVYRTYQKISVKAMEPVVKEYDRQLAKENKAQVADTQVHSLLGLIWIASLQPRFALAETEYAIAHATDPHDKYVGIAIQSIAMHAEGWPHLAKLNAEQAKALVSVNNLSNRYTNAITLVHVTGSVLAIKQGNFTYAITELRDLGQSTNQPWMVELSDASQDAYDGATSKASEKLEKLQNNSNLTDRERAGVSKVLNVAKAGGKDVASDVITEAVSVVLFETIRKHEATPAVINALPAKYQDDVAKYLQL